MSDRNHRTYSGRFSDHTASARGAGTYRTQPSGIPRMRTGGSYAPPRSAQPTQQADKTNKPDRMEEEAPKKKGGSGMIIGIAVGAIAVALLMILLLGSGQKEHQMPTVTAPDTRTVMTEAE